jgi:hypothetical protein
MKNSKAVASMIIGIITFALMIIAPANTTYTIIVGLAGIAPIVLSVLAKRELKGLKKDGKDFGKKEAIIGKVLGIMTIVLSILYVLAIRLINDVEIASMAYCPYENQVSGCVQNDDGKTSQCMFMEQMEITCNNDVLKPSQYKNYVGTLSDDATPTE